MVISGYMARRILYQSRGSDRLFRDVLHKKSVEGRQEEHEGKRGEEMAIQEKMSLEDYL